MTPPTTDADVDADGGHRAQGDELFPETRWSLVIGTRGTGRDEALAELYRAYWFPLYVFVRKRGHSPEEAEDLAQGFFLKLLKGAHFEKIEGARRGRLRSYLLRGMRNYITNEWRRRSAGKRGGGQNPIPLDRDDAERRLHEEPREEETPESLFERQWAMTLLERAFARLREEYEVAGKLDAYDVLKHTLNRGGESVPFAEIAARLGTSASNARVMAFRMRKQLRALLKDEVRDTVADDSEFEEELGHFLQVLAST